ncbi:hypothetical protein EDD18DRAFT_1463254 [Armillaria luteobubalina]|uniref:Uncharacterized protein n=1 Tax=Armillaria luteobubalina TaxID=153913 RepID=A0AA39Q4H3_9AGAR|nr:hypothetical protein EDD18DRAFT_1463254 [Armillaria luteobubalina]
MPWNSPPQPPFWAYCRLDKIRRERDHGGGVDPAACVRVPRVHMVFSIDNPEYCIGYIVMEYIDAPDCDKSDYQLVSGAVEKLISIPGPTSVPGPIGGGHVIHAFFIDGWTSPIAYDTVDDLQEHVNGVLKYKGDSRRVDLVADACPGLRLCPCNITLEIFKKCEDGTVVALDFRATCFLPPCFFAFAVRMLVDNFSQKVARRVSYPQSSDVGAILSASYLMVPFGNNNIGIPKRLRLPKKL